MKFEIIPLIFSLLLTIASSAPVNEFIPTDEWQFVGEDVAIPGGLEIKMDLDKGGKWARYSPGTSHAAGAGDLVSQGLTDDRENTLALVSLSENDLSKLEDKSYDHDYGVDIMRAYGATLIKLYTSGGSTSDHAGRILGICLRNNQDAARSFTSLSGELLPYLGRLEKRPMMILSALITTPEGLKVARSYNTLAQVKDSLHSTTSKLDNGVVRAAVSLVENLVVSGEQNAEICEWAEICNKSSSLELKSLARNIYGGKDDFAGVKCTRS